MPSCLFYLSRYLCFCRSCVSYPHEDVTTPNSPVLTTSPASSSRLLLGETASVAYGTCSQASDHPVDPQTPAGHFVNSIPDDYDLDGHPSRPPRSTAPIGAGLVIQQPTHLAPPVKPIDQASAWGSLAIHSPGDALTIPSEHPLSYEPSPNQLSGQCFQQPHRQNLGMFNQAHNFAVTGTFVDGNVTYNNGSASDFMEKLLKETIPGAAYDSSARDPPPRCHPGTRLAILSRCLHFIHNCDGEKKMRWIVGAAGVGKSAIMQNVAESPELLVNCHVSIFFSINGRNDGTKAVMTLSYQFAAQSDSYRQVIEQEIARDPSLLRSSMAKQFKKLIVDPFIHNTHVKAVGRVLVIIDGLDECDDPRTQLELLRLISDLCITHPSSPLMWLIASRPEPHIVSFFSRRNVTPTLEKEEIAVDFDAARADVERFLRDKLTEIKEALDTLDPQWPDERDFWKLASASGGLFAYAHTAVRYIGDPIIGNPVSQFSDVLHVIDNHPIVGLSREEHPMALLDALYDRILSRVPDKIMSNTRKILLALASDWDFALKNHGFGGGNFIELCNWLGMTPDEAYAALNHLRSVLYAPRRDEAHKDKPKPFHKSFIDYISDFTRSRFSRDIKDEARRLKIECALRILEEAPDGIKLRKIDQGFCYGTLARGAGTVENISLTWSVEVPLHHGDTSCKTINPVEVAAHHYNPSGGISKPLLRKVIDADRSPEQGSWHDDSSRWPDDAMKLRIYKLAIGEIVAGIKRGDPTFQAKSYIRTLIARFESYKDDFPRRELCDLVFEESQCHTFVAHHILKRIPLKAFKISNLRTILDVKLRFHRPATMTTRLSDPWHPSCLHKRTGEWEDGKDQDWSTAFGTDCVCLDRLKRQVRSWRVQSPDHPVLIMLTSTMECCLELHFVDVGDGMSEWTYRIWLELSLYERGAYRHSVDD